MESNFPEFSAPVGCVEDDSLPHLAISYHHRNLCNAVKINEPPVISNSAEMTSPLHHPIPAYHVPSASVNLDGGPNLPSTDARTAVGILHHSTSSNQSPNKGGESLYLSDHSNSKDPVLKYINQMLMEENMEEQPCVVPNIVALRRTEKSLYDALGKKYPVSPKQTERVGTNQVIDCSSWSACGSSGDQGSNGIIMSSTAQVGVVVEAAVIRPAVPILRHSTSSSESPSKGGESLSLSDHSNSKDPVLKYINQMLMEENMEEQPRVVPNIVALQRTEKSLYDALGKKYPDSPKHTEPVGTNQVIDCSSWSTWGRSSDQGNNVTISTGSNSCHSLDPNSQDVQEGNDYAFINAKSSGDMVLHWNVDHTFQSSSNSVNSLPKYWENFGHWVPRELLFRNIFNKNESVPQFNRGLEEARRIIPCSFHITINEEKNELAPTIRENEEIDFNSRNQLENGLRGRKNHERHYARFEEGRANKQFVSDSEDSELSDLLEKLLLKSKNGGLLSLECKFEKVSETKDPHGPNGTGDHSKNTGNKSTSNLRSLLILCSQAVSTNDFKTARELLRQIRQDSSPTGDGSQRIAHYFANGLEARLAVNIGRSQAFHHSVIEKRTLADKVRAYQLYYSALPFTKFQILFSNYMMLKSAKTAEVLHIIDFGINFGFQWPILIQELSKRNGGVTKLRITGIELPQSGFRPAERIEGTGRRLAKYCERFRVPFEFKAVASASWECIRVADLKIRSGEVVAVNCLSRFEYLYDETVELNCQRDMVLSLIRSMKPQVFIHGIRSGSYNAPFFTTRFREALFHLSTRYDMFDTTVERDNAQRLVLERDFLGREIMNVVACEGLERVERPETYKQWQVRLTRVGFQQLPLDQELIKKARAKLSGEYHKDFALHEETNWMLLGWRGRIISGCTSWVSA